MKGKIGIFKMKHFFAGIGEIRFSSYLLSLCVGKSVLTIIGVVSVFMLTIARIYRSFSIIKINLTRIVWIS